MTGRPYDPARAYDEVPYDAGPIPGAHPDALAVAGLLHGMQPPPVDGCRVLELGCSTGTNLLALASALPSAELFGIDASPHQIEIGRARIAAAGVPNVRLECRLIEEPAADAPTYDYILCHGVFSWVDRAVQQQILQTCRAQLAPQGLAYISYNTMPGWHLRQQLRSMLLFHVHTRSTAAERLEQARALLEFTADSLAERTDPYAVMLRDEVRSLQQRADAYIAHEFLEDVNSPEYFSDFVARAAAAGLHYVDEARHASDPKLPPTVRDALAQAGADHIATEQYLDFLGGRMFRRSVLRRADATIDTASVEDALTLLRVAAPVTPARVDVQLNSDETETFRFARGQQLQTNHPAMKHALVLLGTTYPASVSFDELCAALATRLAAVGVPLQADARAMLAGWLRQCHRSGLIELHAWQPPFAFELTDRPRANALARLEAAEGALLLTSIRHAAVELHPFDRALVPLLDGTLDRGRLTECMAHVRPPDGAGAATTAQHVDLALHRLARSGILVASYVLGRIDVSADNSFTRRYRNSWPS